MRVAFVSLETSEHRDTAGARRFERIARTLASRGHEVTLFCGQWWDDYRDETTVENLRYRGVTLGTATSSFVARLPALLASYRPDVVHVRPTPAKQVVAALTGARLARAPLVLEWFGDETPDPNGRLTGLSVTKSSRVVTPSELVRTEVRELGANGEATRVIPESIDFSLVESTDPGERIEVAWAHPLDQSANLDDLLLGLAELRERDWSATIIGDGPLRGEYETEAATLRIDDRVSFVGDCDRETRVGIYRGAHAFAQTAFRVNFATELLWALACGCVGIVEYQTESSAHELIENYDRSYRVTSAQQVANAILESGEFEYRTVDETWETFDHDEVIERYLDEYRAVQ